MRGEGEGASHETREREGSTERVDFFFDSLIERTPPPGGFAIYYVPSSRTVSERNPLEEPGTNFFEGGLLTHCS